MTTPISVPRCCGREIRRLVRRYESLTDPDATMSELLEGMHAGNVRRTNAIVTLLHRLEPIARTRIAVIASDEIADFLERVRMLAAVIERRG